MSTAGPSGTAIPAMVRLPEHRDAYYGGAWHAPSRGRYAETINPGTGEVLAKVADCTAADVEAAIAAAAAGFQIVAPGRCRSNVLDCCGALPACCVIMPASWR